MQLRNQETIISRRYYFKIRSVSLITFEPPLTQQLKKDAHHCGLTSEVESILRPDSSVREVLLNRSTTRSELTLAIHDQNSVGQ